MAVGEVRREGADLWGVYVSGQWYATFGSVLDANCFALQLMERGLADGARLVSGVIVPK